MFLLVTNKRDLTSDLVVLELGRRGLPALRLNTEDLADGALELQPATSAFKLQVGGWTTASSEVRAAYFRRPEPVQLLQAVPDDCRLYSAMEWQSALEGLYSALDGRWLNSPHHILTAENKVKQLALASRLGFRVPATLVTNSYHAARDFCANRSVVGKPLRQALLNVGGTESVVFTTRVKVNAATDPRSLASTPVILQEEVKKRFDVRVTVVGEQIFAATIDSQSFPETEVDWRRSSRTDLEHQQHTLPEAIAGLCMKLTRDLGLRFGAIDLVLDTDGEYWFLEINPNGQWGWIEIRTGHPIASAIVDELVRIGQTGVAS